MIDLNLDGATRPLKVQLFNKCSYGIIALLPGGKLLQIFISSGLCDQILFKDNTLCRYIYVGEVDFVCKSFNVCDYVPFGMVGMALQVWLEMYCL